MAIASLDHVNIRTADLGATVRFFEEILDLEARPVPGSDEIKLAAWMHDERGHPVLHLGSAGLEYPSDATRPWQAATGGGAIHHVAFECTDYDAMRDRVVAHGYTPVETDFPGFGVRQIFVEDPNGIVLELNFRGGRS